MPNCQPLLVNTKDEILFLNQEDILFCNSQCNYATIYLNIDKGIMVCKTLAALYADLYPAYFLKVSQSYIINIDHVKSINKKKKLIYLTGEIGIPYTVKLKVILTHLEQKYNKSSNETVEDNLDTIWRYNLMKG